MQEYLIKVSDKDAGKRLDLFLADFSRNNSLGLSRSCLKKIIQLGLVTQNNTPLKAHYKVKPDDEFRVLLQDKQDQMLMPQNLPLDIVYEDEDLAVINKPAGLVVHSGPGNTSYTLVNALLYHFKSLSDIHPQRPGIVHRLDKDTSGLLVVAKNNASHLSLAKQFAEHSIQRTYIALVRSSVEFDEDVIEMPIGRHPYKRKNMAVGFGKKTRYAKTHYRTLKRTSAFSLLEVRPFTGRTHQIRVHLSFLGHPILGDYKYGKNNAFSRLALHAQSLKFQHPRSNKLMEFTSPLPEEFKEFLNKAREASKPLVPIEKRLDF